MAEDTERFIDAEDQGFTDQIQGYETIVLMQIKECVKVLSKDPIQMISKESKGVLEQKSNELYDEEFNHVDTLKRVMIPFIQGKDLDAVKEIYDDIENYKKEMGDKRVIDSKGIIRKVSEVGSLPANHILSKRVSMYRAEKARELFEKLIVIYHNKKSEIASFSTEG